MKNSLGREFPDELLAYCPNGVYSGAYACKGKEIKTSVSNRTVYPGDKKLVKTIREAIELSGLRDGMTISFHHHLRDGDLTMRLVLDEIDRMGFRDIKIAASAFFECHRFVEDFIRKGVVSGIQANYITGPLADAISNGILEQPVVMRTHGGRDRALESGELKVDVAFLAAPSADCYGNLCAIDGPSAFGSFGYAYSDARYAGRVVAITDSLRPYPLPRVSIDQTLVDYVVEVPKIGDVSGISSGTTKMTRDPSGRKIASMTAEAIENSAYFQNGFSFQTGAGGVSLATAYYVRQKMLERKIQGSFGLGGITGPMVKMLRDGCFNSLLDAQCFDLEAIASLRDDMNHREISSSTYSNPHNKGAVVNMLDVAVLGATEIDTDFNVNVTTSSDGVIMGGSGGHADAAAGCKMTIIVANLHRGRFPTVVDQVTTINTPGETVDVLVTEWGVTVNPRRGDILERLQSAKMPLIDMRALKAKADQICGVPGPLDWDEKITAVVQYRDGTLIDAIRRVK